LIHNPESIVFAWAQDEEEGAMYKCRLKELPKYNGSAEGEKGIGKGEMFLSTGLYSSTTTECDVPVYWHVSLENDTYLHSEEYPTGWYEEKEYYKIVKRLLVDYAILTGGIHCSFSRNVEYADLAIGHFCMDREISEDIFDFIDLYYSKVCREEKDVCNNSGRVDNIPILYDVVEFAYTFGTVTAIRYLTKEVAQEVADESAKKFAREVLSETIEKGAEGWSKSALKKGDYFIYYGFKEVDGGGKLLYIGKSFGDDLFGRYSAGQIRKMDALIFSKLRNIPNNGTAKGVEQAIMELNGWVADPILRRESMQLLSNKINSTTNVLYKKAGINWLNNNIPNWRVVFKIE